MTPSSRARAVAAVSVLLGAVTAWVIADAGSSETPVALPEVSDVRAEASDEVVRAQPSDEPRAPASEDVAEAVSEPTRIRIPAIGVDAEIVGVGLKDDGAMETPDFGLAGWYTKGPKPGEAGPSVVVAHVDSKAGPDVFYRLRELQPGAEIHIERSDGSTGTWVAASSEQTDKDELPVDSIWNSTERPVLRLVTCGGAFDRSIGHYTDNVIVYADPRA
jgi:sortase (surface protein transpeptidase)